MMKFTTKDNRLVHVSPAHVAAIEESSVTPGQTTLYLSGGQKITVQADIHQVDNALTSAPTYAAAPLIPVDRVPGQQVDRVPGQIG
jgi:hypothetical protein